MRLERCTRGLCKTCPEEQTCKGMLKYYQKIVIDYKLDNWNDTINHCRNNKYGANNRKKREMDVVRYHLLGIKKIPRYPIKLRCTWHVVNMNSDLDNKSLKAVLDQKSYLRIETPIKVEKEQLIKKIGEISKYDLYMYLNDLSDYFNIDVLEKLRSEQI